MRINCIVLIWSLRLLNKIRVIFIFSCRNSRKQIKSFCIAHFVVIFAFEIISWFASFRRALRLCYCLTIKRYTFVSRFRCKLRTKRFAISFVIRIYTNFCDAQSWSSETKCRCSMCYDHEMTYHVFRWWYTIHVFYEILWLLRQ